MAAPIVFTNAEAAAIHQRLVDGSPCRKVASRFQEKYGRSVSHTTVLSVARRVQAEQWETETVFDDVAATKLRDGEQLSEAIRRLRRLEAKAQMQRPDQLGPARVALRALDLQIRALRFKMSVKTAEEPAGALSEVRSESFPAENFPVAAEVVIALEAAENQDGLELPGELSNGLSNGLSSEPSISIVDEIPTAPEEARQPTGAQAEAACADRPDDIPYEELPARARLKLLDARMKEILASVRVSDEKKPAPKTPPPAPAPPAVSISPVPPRPPIEQAQRSYPLSELIHPGWPGAPRP